MYLSRQHVELGRSIKSRSRQHIRENGSSPPFCQKCPVSYKVVTEDEDSACSDDDSGSDKFHTSVSEGEEEYTGKHESGEEGFTPKKNRHRASSYHLIPPGMQKRRRSEYASS